MTCHFKTSIHRHTKDTEMNTRIWFYKELRGKNDGKKNTQPRWESWKTKDWYLNSHELHLWPLSSSSDLSVYLLFCIWCLALCKWVSHYCLQLYMNVPKIHKSAVFTLSTVVSSYHHKQNSLNQNLFTRDDYSSPSRMMVSPPRHNTFLMHIWPINATLPECTAVNLTCCFGFPIFTTETARVDVVRGPYQPATLSKMDWKHAYIQLQNW